MLSSTLHDGPKSQVDAPTGRSFPEDSPFSHRAHPRPGRILLLYESLGYPSLTFGERANRRSLQCFSRRRDANHPAHIAVNDIAAAASRFGRIEERRSLRGSRRGKLHSSAGSPASGRDHPSAYRASSAVPLPLPQARVRADRLPRAGRVQDGRRPWLPVQIRRSSRYRLDRRCGSNRRRQHRYRAL